MENPEPSFDEYAKRFPAEHETAQLFLDFVKAHPQNFSHRDNQAGHVTGSAWVLNHERTHALLARHAVLGRWFQFGGHVEPGDASIFEAAARELREESGLASVESLGEGIFDLDRHPIPARGAMPEHFHYDVRYAFIASDAAPLNRSDESTELRWVALEQISALERSESISRLVRKSPLIQ